MGKPKYFICTLGTSIAGSNKELAEALRGKQAHPGEWGDGDPMFEKKLGDHVSATLKDKSNFHACCAEASVLRKAGVAHGDRVVLLSTDTGLARMCSEAVKRLIVAGFGLDDSSVELVRVEGLQVSDAERLRKTGLSSFVKAVASRIEDNRYAAEIFLCPVGGYKGVVPFLTALGMSFHLPVLYTFERIDSLVRLPPLPFTLDRELYGRAKEALLELGKKSEMHESEFLNRIKGYQPDERELFLSFVEPSGNPGFVTSTAFTETFAPQFECNSAPVSRKAIEDLGILSHGHDYRTACKMVLLSQDRLVRGPWLHSKTDATDLQILKQGRTSIRILGYETAGRFYVCRVLPHCDYERLLGSRKCPQIADYRGKEFIEWTEPPEILPDSVKDEESPFEAAMRQMAEFESKLKEINSEWATRVVELKRRHISKVEALKGDLAAATDAARKAQSDLDKTKNALQNSQAEQAALAEKIDGKDAENRELKEKLDEEAQKVKSALAEINKLRRNLRNAQTRLAMAPGDTEVLKKAQQEIKERKAQLEEAFQTLLMSEKPENTAQPSEEAVALQFELRTCKAQLAAKADEVSDLEKDNASLAESLRKANATIRAQSNLGFFGRLRHLFFPQGK